MKFTAAIFATLLSLATAVWVRPIQPDSIRPFTPPSTLPTIPTSSTCAQLVEINADLPGSNAIRKYSQKVSASTVAFRETFSSAQRYVYYSDRRLPPSPFLLTLLTPSFPVGQMYGKQ